MLKVAADVTPLLTPRTGIGVFVGELIDRLALRNDLTLTGYAVTWRGREKLAATVPPGMAVVRRPLAARPAHQAWMRLDRPRIDWWTGHQDIIWGTNYVIPPTSAISLVSIYDLTPLKFPELTTAHTRNFPILIQRALRRGAMVHTMSRYVRDEIVDHFDIDPDRVHVVPGGVRPSAPAPPAAPPGGQGPYTGAPYILALGTVEPRKDLPTLVAAFDLLAADHPELRLVIAGPDGWGADALTDAVTRSTASDRILRLGWVEEAERHQLLHNATVYAFPSLYEGFGFPPLEAMDAGVPVVASTAGSLPEVCGKGADLVPPRDPEALAKALLRAIQDTEHRDDLIRRGHQTTQLYSWDAATEQFAKLLHTLHNP